MKAPTEYWQAQEIEFLINSHVKNSLKKDNDLYDDSNTQSNYYEMLNQPSQNKNEFELTF